MSKKSLHSYSGRPPPASVRSALTLPILTATICLKSLKSTTKTIFGSHSNDYLQTLRHRQSLKPLKRLQTVKLTVRLIRAPLFSEPQTCSQLKAQCPWSSLLRAKRATWLWIARHTRAWKPCRPVLTKRWKWSTHSLADSWPTSSASTPGAIASSWRAPAWSCTIGGTSTWGPSRATCARRPSRNQGRYPGTTAPYMASIQLFRWRQIKSLKSWNLQRLKTAET